MKYKLIAIDLDGTLLNDYKKIPKENIEVLRRLYKSGVEIVIATGRRYFQAKEFIKALGFEIVILANNGNIVRQIKNDKVLITKYLIQEHFYNLINLGKQNDLIPLIHVNHYEDGYDILVEKEYKNNFNPYISSKVDRVVYIDNYLKYNKKKVLSVCYLGDFNKLNSFNEMLNCEYKGIYSSHIMTNLRSFDALLEVMNPLGSKWKSLIEYAKNKGISKDEIIAIGDDNNDIEMIMNAGLGIGLKNSSQNIKEISDIITDLDNNDCGVAKILSDVFKL